MAKLKNFLKLNSLMGKLGAFTYRRGAKGTIVSTSVMENKSKTERQQFQRLSMANAASVYRLFEKALWKGFELKYLGQKDYNAYMSANLRKGAPKVFFSKDMKVQGASVVAPYTISTGSLNSVAVTVSGGSCVSDISVGSLVIDGSTTVGQLSQAVVDNNRLYRYDDQISFFLLEQTVDAVTSIPRAVLSKFEVTLDKYDTALLWDIASADGFTTVDGRLGTKSGLPEGGVAWVHTRKGKSLQVSTQTLVVTSELYKSYTTKTAFDKAVATYGGLTETPFLQPDTEDLWAEIEEGGDSPVTPTPSSNVTITANANDTQMGSVSGGGTYVQGASVTLTATANEGYHFVSWSNGRTTASITVTADADATYTATFAADGQGGSGDNSGMDG